MGKSHAPFFKWWEYIFLHLTLSRDPTTARERIPTRRHHHRRANPHEAASRQEKLCKAEKHLHADPSGAHSVYSASDFGTWPVRRELQLLNHPTTSVVVHRCLRASNIVSEASGWALLQRNASSILAATCRRTCAFPSRTNAQLVSAAAIRASTVTSIETRHSSRPRRPASLSTWCASERVLRPLHQRSAAGHERRDLAIAQVVPKTRAPRVIKPFAMTYTRARHLGRNVESLWNVVISVEDSNVG